MTESETVEAVAKRLEGKKRFVIGARETVYYEVEVWAANREEADELSCDIDDWGDPVDGCDFEVYHIDEVKQ